MYGLFVSHTTKGCENPPNSTKGCCCEIPPNTTKGCSCTHERLSYTSLYGLFVSSRPKGLGVHTCVVCVRETMGWLRLVGSLKWQVSFAEYSLFYRALLQKRPTILRSLLIVATPYFDTRCVWSSLYPRETVIHVVYRLFVSIAETAVYRIASLL